MLRTTFLDDWGVANLDATTRGDLLEIIDDRAAVKATIITAQLPVEHWHAWIGDATIADAILDRLMQHVHRINLSGPSLRDPDPKPPAKRPRPKRRPDPGTGDAYGDIENPEPDCGCAAVQLTNGPCRRRGVDNSLNDSGQRTSRFRGFGASSEGQ